VGHPQPETGSPNHSGIPKGHVKALKPCEATLVSTRHWAFCFTDWVFRSVFKHGDQQAPAPGENGDRWPSSGTLSMRTGCFNTPDAFSFVER